MPDPIRPTAGLLVLLLLVHPAAGSSEWASIRGQVVTANRVSDMAKVRATPLDGTGATHAPVAVDGAFRFEGLPPGRYRLELLSANNVVLAEAGAQVVTLAAGENVVELHLLGPPPAEGRPRAQRERAYRMKIVVLGAGLAALGLVCQAADCFGGDSASPTTP